MIAPVGPRVLVKVEMVEKTTKSGLILPEQAVDREQYGAVKGELVAIGPLAWKDFQGGEAWAKVGDTVYFAKYGGFMIQDGDVQYRVLNDEDIVSVEKKKK